MISTHYNQHHRRARCASQRSRGRCDRLVRPTRSRLDLWGQRRPSGTPDDGVGRWTQGGAPVDETPQTRYVAVGDADVAYQVVGDGPIDVLYFYGLGSHIEVLHLTPGFEEFLRHLSSCARVILFDRRGTGASDGVSRHAIPTFEAWTD